MRVALIGTGRMGAPMARNILKQNHALAAYDVSAKALATLEDSSARICTSAVDAVRDAEIVLTSLPGPKQVEFVMAEIEPAVTGDAIVADTSTTSPEQSRAMAARFAAKNVAYLDAPISGGVEGAVKGTLTVMVGGDAADFDKAKPVIEAYARAVNLIGATGSGQLTKMVNQICIGGLIQALAEALHFAQAAGLDVGKVVETISKGAAQSWQMDNRWKTMLDGKFDFGFAVDWVRKDFALVFEEARANGAELPVTALVDRFYAEIQAMGGGRWDTSSLIARLERN